jgi:hypothetical protein
MKEISYNFFYYNYIIVQILTSHILIIKYENILYIALLQQHLCYNIEITLKFLI